jgi:hypothetical protein
MDCIGETTALKIGIMECWNDEPEEFHYSITPLFQYFMFSIGAMEYWNTGVWGNCGPSFQRSIIPVLHLY